MGEGVKILVGGFQFDANNQIIDELIDLLIISMISGLVKLPSS